jgi:hypothetical protein
MLPKNESRWTVRTQDGKLNTVGELVAAHLPAYDFAGKVVRCFVEPTTLDDVADDPTIVVDRSRIAGLRAQGLGWKAIARR